MDPDPPDSILFQTAEMFLEFRYLSDICPSICTLYRLHVFLDSLIQIKISSLLCIHLS